MKNCAVSLFVTLLAACVMQGCIELTKLSQGAQDVRVISEFQAKDCRFLDSISTTGDYNLNLEQDARIRAFNRVYELGGNALRITSTSTQVLEDTGGSAFSLSGDAYACPTPSH